MTTVINQAKGRIFRKQLWVIFVVLAMTVLSVTVVLVTAPQNNRKQIIADVAVSAYHVNQTSQVELYNENFAFSSADVDACKKTTSFDQHISIDPNNDIKLVYDVKNDTKSLYAFKLDFDGVEIQNCNVFYTINDGTETLMAKKAIAFEVDQNISISLLIKVADANQTSKFVGNILFMIQSV